MQNEPRWEKLVFGPQVMSQPLRCRLPSRVPLRSGPGRASSASDDLIPHGPRAATYPLSRNGNSEDNLPPFHPARTQDDTDTSSTQPWLTISRGQRPGQVRPPKQVASGLRQEPSGKRVPFRPGLSSVEASFFTALRPSCCAVMQDVAGD